uniref:hypothetical protein n=1 Tax=Nocardia cyriacigeorgica TaxID=135487 RepID=UPI0024589BEC
VVTADRGAADPRAVAATTLTRDADGLDARGTAQVDALRAITFAFNQDSLLVVRHDIIGDGGTEVS